MLLWALMLCVSCIGVSSVELELISNVTSTGLGSAVNISCRVKLIRDGENVDFHWRTPNGCTDNCKDLQTEIWPQEIFAAEGPGGSFKHNLLQQTIIIAKVSKKHEGYYVCKAKVSWNSRHNYPTALYLHEFLFLEVTAPGDRLVNLKITSPSNVTGNGDIINWQGFVNVRNGPVDLQWTMAGHDSVVLAGDQGVFSAPVTISGETHTNMSFRQKVNYTTGHFQLQIKGDLLREAAFELRATLKNSGHMKTIPVEVFRKFDKFQHHLVIEPPQPKPRESVTIICEIFSEPPQFILNLRALQSDKCAGETVPQQQFSTLTRGISVHRPVAFMVTVNASESGAIECSNQKIQLAYLCVSDINDVTIDGPSEVNLTVGDTLELKCKAPTCRQSESHYLPQPNILDWTFKSGSNITELGAITDNCTHSKQSTLKLVKVAEENSGLYTCSIGNTVFDVPSLQASVFVTVYPKIRPENDSNTAIFTAAIIIMAIVLLSTLIAAGIYLHYLKVKGNRYLEMLNCTYEKVHFINNKLPIYEQIELLPFDKKWLFPKRNLTMKEQLGAGFFGVVNLGEAKGIIEGEAKTTVAVKMTNAKCERDIVISLIKELKIMSLLGRHPNLVGLLGANIDKLSGGELMIIMEYCPYGNVRNYLLENTHRFNSTKKSTNGLPDLNESVLVSWAYQISRGIMYLANRRVVHGDLAARNILLCENNIVKICDFGLSCNLNKDYYQKDEKIKLPFRWLAIESFQYYKFSVQSDVWSYGVTLWEIFTFGQVPYSEIEGLSNVWQAIVDGRRLEKPELAPQAVYDCMLACWNADPKLRPPIREICDKLSHLVEPALRDSYVRMENEYANFAKPEVDYLMMCGTPDWTPHYVNLPTNEASLYEVPLGKSLARASGYVDMSGSREYLESECGIMLRDVN